MKFKQFLSLIVIGIVICELGAMTRMQHEYPECCMNIQNTVICMNQALIYGKYGQKEMANRVVVVKEESL